MIFIHKFRFIVFFPASLNLVIGHDINLSSSTVIVNQFIVEPKYFDYPYSQSLDTYLADQVMH